MDVGRYIDVVRKWERLWGGCENGWSFLECKIPYFVCVCVCVCPVSSCQIFTVREVSTFLFCACGTWGGTWKKGVLVLMDSEMLRHTWSSSTAAANSFVCVRVSAALHLDSFPAATISVLLRCPCVCEDCGGGETEGAPVVVVAFPFWEDGGLSFENFGSKSSSHFLSSCFKMLARSSLFPSHRTTFECLLLHKSAILESRRLVANPFFFFCGWLAGWAAVSFIICILKANIRVFCHFSVVFLLCGKFISLFSHERVYHIFVWKMRFEMSSSCGHACGKEAGWLEPPLESWRMREMQCRLTVALYNNIFNMDLARLAVVGKDYLLSAEFLSKFRALKVRDLF